VGIDDAVAATYHHVGTFVALSWIDLFAALTLAPAAIAVGLLAMRGSPRLGLAGMVLVVPGLLNPDRNSGDALCAAARAGLPKADAQAVLDHLAELPVNGWFGFVAFYLAFVVGGLLLGTALLVGRTAPRWAAVSLMVSSLIGVAGAVTDLGQTAGLVAWLLVTVALTGCAARIAGPQRPTSSRTS
jgi:hypothetical protein